jgi:hypothetical protein
VFFFFYRCFSDLDGDHLVLLLLSHCGGLKRCTNVRQRDGQQKRLHFLSPTKTKHTDTYRLEKMLMSAQDAVDKQERTAQKRQRYKEWSANEHRVQER